MGDKISSIVNTNVSSAYNDRKRIRTSNLRGSVVHTTAIIPWLEEGIGLKGEGENNITFIAPIPFSSSIKSIKVKSSTPLEGFRGVIGIYGIKKDYRNISLTTSKENAVYQIVGNTYNKVPTRFLRSMFFGEVKLADPSGFASIAPEIIPFLASDQSSTNAGQELTMCPMGAMTISESILSGLIDLLKPINSGTPTNPERTTADLYKPFEKDTMCMLGITTKTPTTASNNTMVEFLIEYVEGAPSEGPSSALTSSENINDRYSLILDFIRNTKKEK